MKKILLSSAAFLLLTAVNAYPVMASCIDGRAIHALTARQDCHHMLLRSTAVPEPGGSVQSATFFAEQVGRSPLVLAADKDNSKEGSNFPNLSNKGQRPAAAKSNPKKGNNPNGQDGKVICDQQYRFSIPGCPDPKCGVQGVVDQQIRVICPPPPSPPSLCPNGEEPEEKAKERENGKNGEKEKKGEKEEKEPEPPSGPDRIWDSVQNG
jgi:hypothetical protein